MADDELRAQFQKSYTICKEALDQMFSFEYKFKKTGDSKHLDKVNNARKTLLHEIDPLNMKGVMSLHVEIGSPWEMPNLGARARSRSRSRSRKLRQPTLHSFFKQ